jgi:hypothetical protein
MGLGIVVIGAALIIVQNQRGDRAALQASINELRRSLEAVALSASSHNGSSASVPADSSVDAPAPASARDPAAPGTAAVAESGEVVAGPSAYHRPSCRLLQNRASAMPKMSREQAEAMGLAPCRVCSPATVGNEEFMPSR